jgi:Ca2+-binding EF-hand superfamily protein
LEWGSEQPLRQEALAARKLAAFRNVNERGFVMRKISLIALILASGLGIAGGALAQTATPPTPAPTNAAHSAAARLSRLDTNKDGKVTLAELVAAKTNRLHEFDANKDGVITQAEFEAGMKAQRQAHVAKLFERRDTDRDGRLSREESRMPERWFTRLDSNADGFLTPAELAARPLPQGPAREHRGGGEFARLDENADGKVDTREVRDAAARMLRRLDKNSDGVVSVDELQAAGRMHRGRHHDTDEHGPNGAHDGAGSQPS